MRAALLLLTLCSLAAAYAIAPTALDVAQTQDVSPVDPVESSGAVTGELPPDVRDKDNARRLHQVDAATGSTPGIIASGASSSADTSGEHGTVISVHGAQTDIVTDDNGKVQYKTINSGRRLLWGGWGGGWGDRWGGYRGDRGGYSGGGGSAAASSSAAASGNSAAAAAAAAAAVASGRGRLLLDWGWGWGHHDSHHGHEDWGHHHDDRHGWGGWHGSWGGHHEDNSASATAAAAAAAAASGRGRRLLVSSWGQDHGDGHDSNDSKWRSNTDTLPDFSAAALGGYGKA